jgi:hypothetical protein
MKIWITQLSPSFRHQDLAFCFRPAKNSTNKTKSKCFYTEHYMLSLVHAQLFQFTIF